MGCNWKPRGKSGWTTGWPGFHCKNLINFPSRQKYIIWFWNVWYHIHSSNNKWPNQIVDEIWNISNEHIIRSYAVPLWSLERSFKVKIILFPNKYIMRVSNHANLYLGSKLMPLRLLLGCAILVFHDILKHGHHYLDRDEDSSVRCYYSYLPAHTWNSLAQSHVLHEEYVR